MERAFGSGELNLKKESRSICPCQTGCIPRLETSDFILNTSKSQKE
jgi:hypothetical protein